MSDAPSPPPHASIYTKTGDSGHTSLFNSERRSKADDYFEALGDVDELNAHLGLVRSQCPDDDLNEQLTEIQSRLFDVGANLATPRLNSSTSKLARTTFDSQHILSLEKWIDTMDALLPALQNFILPGGNNLTALVHVARAVARRAERHTTPLVIRGDVDQVILQYLNRLSDYLFTVARYVGNIQGDVEVIWRKPRA